MSDALNSGQSFTGATTAQNVSGATGAAGQGTGPLLGSPSPSGTTGLPPTQFTPGAGGTVTAQPGAIAPSTPTAPTTAAPAAPTVSGSTASGFPNDAAMFAADGDVSSSPSVLSNVLNFAKENPTLAGGIATAAGSLIQGVGNEMSGLTPAQINQANAQAAANTAQANLTTQQTQNMAQPKAAASLAPLPANRAPIVTSNGLGLINAA